MHRVQTPATPSPRGTFRRASELRISFTFTSSIDTFPLLVPTDPPPPPTHSVNTLSSTTVRSPIMGNFSTTFSFVAHKVCVSSYRTWKLLLLQKGIIPVGEGKGEAVYRRLTRQKINHAITSLGTCDILPPPKPLLPPVEVTLHLLIAVFHSKSSSPPCRLS